MEKVPFYTLYGETEPANELDFIHIESDTERGRDEHIEWEVHPHRHEGLHQFLYLECGHATINMDEEIKVCDAPCFVSIPPLVVHSFFLEPGSNRYVLTASESFLSSLIASNTPSNTASLLSKPVAVELEAAAYPQDQIHGLIKLLHQEFYGHMEGRVSLISAYLTTLLIQLGRLTEFKVQTESSSPQQSDIYNRFRIEVEKHFREHWKINQYAQLIGVTEDRLNSICKRAVDYPPSQIIHNRLLAEAKRYLVYTNRSSNAIAYELGFTDPSYFSRFFRKHVGETASDFKARYSKSQG